MASETNEKHPPSEAKEAQDSNPAEPSAKTDASSIKSLPTATAEAPSVKKRRSDIQLNKDDHPEGECSEDDGELNDEGEKRSDPFKRASEDVLKTRKIVKVSKKWESAGSGSGGGGVFGGVTLVAPKDEKKEESKEEKIESDGTDKKESAVFGSTAKVPTFGSAASAGFGSTFGSGFGAVSNGFGALKPKTDGEEDKKDDSKSAFGSGFASSGFGSVQSSGFGNSNNDNATTVNKEGAFTASTSTTEKCILQGTQVYNGEENEDCIAEVRAKLYKLVPLDETEKTEEIEQREHVPSVPSTSGRMELNKNSEKKEEEVTGNKIELEWKSFGVGPTRVLTEKNTEKKKGRIIHRQETAAGSAGMHVLLNVALGPECKVTRTSEKTVKLDAPNANKDTDGRALNSCSFKVKTPAEADLLMAALEKLIDQE